MHHQNNTGVHDDNTGLHDDDDQNNTGVQDDNTEYNTEKNDDDISVENEDYDYNHISIDDLNTIEQININTDQETGNKTSYANEGWRPITNHGYNLRPCPMRQHNKYTLTQDGQQSTQKRLAKPHAHIMKIQMNIKQCIKAFGKRGNDTLLKELNQLHEHKALLPLRRRKCPTNKEKRTMIFNFPKRKT